MKKLLSGFLAVFLFVTAFSFLHPHPLTGAQPTNVKDTLSTSQLSYFARLGAGNSTADLSFLIALTANPSNNTNNLFVGDSLGIGTTNLAGNPLTAYVVRDIGNTAIIQLTAGIGVSNTFTGAAVISTRSAIHTVSFTPQNSVSGGAWQFLIKATSRTGEVQNDGIPDQQGFDLGSTTPSSGATGVGTRLQAADISCPWGGSATIGTTTSVTIGSATNYYHIIQCGSFSGGTTPTGVGGTIVVGRPLASGSQLINPSAALNHIEGSATGSVDVYDFLIRHLDGGGAVVDVDTERGKIAVVESVRVTATVEPSITFTIGTSGVVAVGATACGVPMSNGAPNTTAVSASFGSLTLSAFNDLAHHLSCVTNAPNGYVVTAYEMAPMTMIGTTITISDTICQGSGSGNCTIGVGKTWATNTASGWGYTMQNIGASTTLFSYPNYKPFGIGSTSAQEIMKNTLTPSATETAFICYRLTAATTQTAGNYENHLVYTATATF
jgi:hypothetical protein